MIICYFTKLNILKSECYLHNIGVARDTELGQLITSNIYISTTLTRTPDPEKRNDVTPNSNMFIKYVPNVFSSYISCIMGAHLYCLKDYIGM